MASALQVSGCSCPLCTALSGQPTVTATATTIFDLVKSDLDERDRIGARHHGGRTLLAPSSKDWLREAYEEALDLAVYLRGALAESDWR